MSAGFGAVRALPWLRPGLVAALDASTVEMPRRETREFNGRHAVVRPRDDHQDDLILEVRRLYEQIGLPPLAIHAYITDLGHVRSLGWVRQTTQYHNRAHLVPKPRAAPYLPTHTSEGL